MWSIFNVAVFDVVHCVLRLSGSEVALNINEGIILHVQDWLEKPCRDPFPYKENKREESRYKLFSA